MRTVCVRGTAGSRTASTRRTSAPVGLPTQRGEQLVDDRRPRARASRRRCGPGSGARRTRARARAAPSSSAWSSAACDERAEATSTAGLPSASKLHHVVQTAGHAGASIGERLDHRVAARGDVAAQVGRRGLGERRLGLAQDVVTALAQQRARARRGRRRRAACGCRAARSRASPQALGQRRSTGSRSAVGSRSSSRLSSPWLHAPARLRADLARRPAPEDHAEQAGVAAGVGDEDAVGRRELRRPASRGR